MRAAAFQRWPQDDDELWEFVATLWGVRIPRIRVCPGHHAPFEAFADAYFARAPVAVWKASRGFGGKSRTLSILGLTEIVALAADIVILAGSGAQSAGVHKYMNDGWNADLAPRHLLRGDPSVYETRLRNGGRVRALMASQTSARGPHPQRLRMDEVDEVPLPILDAAMGQTMASDAVAAQTVLSSTHHNPDGTFTEVLTRAADKGWAIYEWCWKESMRPHGWLDPAEVERKRSEVTTAAWLTEYDLQEPSAEGRAIVPEAVEAMFTLPGVWRGAIGEEIEIEPPERGARYATGTDWGRDVHYTAIVTWRTDVLPWRLVAFLRDGRRPWPAMVAAFNARVRRYPGPAAHDATGLGKVVEDLLEVQATGVDLVGKGRAALFAEYIAGIERGEFSAPKVEFMYTEHKYARLKDLYGGGSSDHPPDSFVAGALASLAAGKVLPHGAEFVVGRKQTAAREGPWSASGESS